MNKKSITAILVLSLFIITSYASIPLSVCAYTDDIKELETEEFNRELIYYDFEDNVVGKNPYNVAIYAETPATGLVEQLDDNKVVALNCNSGKEEAVYTITPASLRLKAINYFYGSFEVRTRQMPRIHQIA